MRRPPARSRWLEGSRAASTTSTASSVWPAMAPARAKTAGARRLQRLARRSRDRPSRPPSVLCRRSQWAGGTGGAGGGLSPGSGRVTTGGGDCLAHCNRSLERPGLPWYQHRLESTIRYDHHLPSWPGDDWHSVALAAELISSSTTAMDELALVTRASLAARSARRAPSSRISLSAARPLRLVLFFGVVPACMADILHRLRPPRMVAVSTMCSGWNTISMMSFV